jgi:hypothetical protein
MPSGPWFRRMALPFVLVSGLAGWSAYWVYAQDRVEAEIDREMAQLHASGGSFACADRQWQGFPLRIALSCGATRLDVPEGPVIEIASLQSSSHLHSPRRIDTVADGPTRVRLATGETLALDHTPARIGFVAADGAPQGSLAVDRVDVQADAGWSFGGRNVALAAGVKAPDRLAFSASGDALTFADPRMPAIRLDALEVAGWVDGVPRTLSKDLRTVLEAAARQGSRVTIETFRAQLADVAFTASGTVELTPEGPTGTLSTTVSNYKAFLADLERRGVIGKKAVRASAMVIGLLHGGRKKEDGEVTVDLRFHEGQVFWGPFAVAEIPPLE